jgi:NitT/TauT family transport system ATP-binding protein
MSEQDSIVVEGNKRVKRSERVRADRTDQLYKDIPEGETLMSIKNLRVVYRTDESETVAVEDFSLDVKKGELVSIVGPSGCGKTTILRCIAGLLQPTSGTITMGGKPCTAPGSDRGMVFQDFALFPWRTVKQNVEFGMEVAGVPKAEREERAMRYLKAVGLGDFADSRVHELSGGMKQRVGIARALVMHPAVTLMDEPFGALDAQTRNIMQEQLTRIIMHSERTVIFITHSVDEALYLSDRVVILSKRPSTIHTIIDVPWPRPRDRASPEFTKMRRDILDFLETQNVLNDESGTITRKPEKHFGDSFRAKHEEREEERAAASAAPAESSAKESSNDGTESASGPREKASQNPAAGTFARKQDPAHPDEINGNLAWRDTSLQTRVVGMLPGLSAALVFLAALIYFFAH